jgi:hypothetical protein
MENLMVGQRSEVASVSNAYVVGIYGLKKMRVVQWSAPKDLETLILRTLGSNTDARVGGIEGCCGHNQSREEQGP